MIFITGCARSGTSLVSRIVKHHGCYLGRVDKYWENLDIRNKVIKPYLNSVGADPLGQKTLPKEVDLWPYPTLREDVFKIIGGKGLRSIKTPKITMMWPLFAAAFDDAKFVVVRRDREQIIKSCIRAGFLGSKYLPEWEQFVDAYICELEKISSLPNAIEIWPERVLANHEEFKAVSEFCGLTFNLSAVAASINPLSFHRTGT